MTTDFESITVEHDQGVAEVRLNRPKKANALNAKKASELIAAFQQLDQDPEVRVVIVGGSGAFFSSGIDLQYLREIQQQVLSAPEPERAEVMRDIILHLQRVTNAVELCSKPVIAAINGVCYGFGVDFAAACDLRYCQKRARMSVKEIDLAIVADLGSLQRLPGIIGEGRARELAMTGRDFFGEEAAAMGFVHQSFPNANELKDGVRAVAQNLATKSPHTLRGIKKSMNYSRDQSVAAGLAQIADANSTALLHDDLQEAVAAFLEKRPPQFLD
jgi:enoyl-CoA hydratase